MGRIPSRTAFALAVAVIAGPSAVAAARDPSGAWLTEDSRARVRVERCGPAQDSVCGYIVWLDGKSGENALDAKNPDPRRATRAVLGHQMLLGLKANRDGQYEGLVYNAEDGRTYDVTVWLESSGELKVKGCLMGFLCSTQSWTRTGDLAPGQLAGATGTPGGPRPDPEWAARPTGSTSAGPRRDAKPRP